MHHVEPPGRPCGDRVLTAAQMRAADKVAIEQLGVPGIALMENASRHVAAAAAARTTRERTIGIVCGGGNNGGDGLGAARHLHAWGYPVEVLLARAPDSYAGDAAVNLETCRRAGVPMRRLDAPDTVELPVPRHYGLLLDALLGTGLTGEVRGAASTLIDWINAHGVPVVAVDIPSGLCSDTGRPLGKAVRAVETVTFAASKRGHWLYPGPTYVGRLNVVDIGMPTAALSRSEGPVGRLLGDRDLAPAFAPRPPDGHKGRQGHVYLLGGTLGRTGAIRMGADAALRAGAGLVTLGTTPQALHAVAGAVYEVMAEAALDLEPDALADRINARDAAVIGPGYPTDPGAGDTLLALWHRLAVPVVLDADGLNLVAGRLEALQDGPPHILTPHPGEAGRLLGCTAADVQSDRIGAVRALVEKSGGVVVLKGAHTLVAARGEEVFGICPDGNAGMATAGMGDVLAGLIGALLARGVAPLRAAAAAVVWHARAGDLVARRSTQNALLASDVIGALAAVERGEC
ncbi:MAG: NAD(P)H-hydrate dehydratase [Myxococcales bacterium]|nr:NAD(P)H-hydrate dehydratase [Myxococcales bacterium]